MALTTAVIQELNRIKAAEAHVAPHINSPLLASDSADQVYAQALRQIGYRGTVYRGAAKQMFELARKNPQRNRAPAMDAKAQREIAARFPGVAKLKMR